uniref:NADH-ubiquinone oxidoreductase chain 2 n=1 Tax=Gigantometra gigas TaxID=95701 RepID=A0A3T0UBH6_9HEMI|nr:NADH dehydrogenase subunit 2 [Gigantometra gigas]AZZ73255.1 NADH dehydrogenase subunit 2 [Gigantometra gigas]AZZ73268.1 NADH dehydrogenase subunit 2 [Gigantometra gigas]
MMKISTKTMALSTTMLSTMTIMSSENWLSMWMGLEINMLSFIPLMEKEKNYKTSEAKMMYFLIQSMSSIMFIFTIILTPMMMINENFNNQEMMMIITASMMMKLGAAPMHMWFINIMNKISWNNCLLLMTWQKIAPLYIMSNINQNFMIMNMCAMTSSLIGAIGGINQTSIHKIMAFSSVNHLGWLIICLKYDNEMWIKYMIIYMLIIMMMTKTFEKNSINFINQMNMNNKTFMEKMNFMILFLSLGGMPPFIGFLPKWIVVQSLIKESSMMIIMILMFTSMITLFFYMRMMSPMLMNYNTMNKWNIKNNNLKNFNMIKIMINFSLPLTMMMNMI